jgi:hypothetical protein
VVHVPMQNRCVCRDDAPEPDLERTERSFHQPVPFLSLLCGRHEVLGLCLQVRAAPEVWTDLGLDSLSSMPVAVPCSIVPFLQLTSSLQTLT